MPVEHVAWIGDAYTKGIGGQKVAIVGYSHWVEGGVDHPEFTRDRIKDMISGASRLSFFSSIRNAFGEDSHQEFWPKVMFLNLMPSGSFSGRGVVEGEDRFIAGTADAIQAGNVRLDRLICKNYPDKVFLFTSKGFEALTPLIEERGGQPLPRLPGTDIRFGHHALNPASIIIGSRHPQGASRRELRLAVDGGLAL